MVTSPHKTYRAFFLYVILILAALAGNYFNITLYEGADILFGSIAVLIAVSFYGTFWGALVALISSSYTIILWHHPYGILLYTTEALFVGYFIQYKKKNLLLMDMVFWLFIGMPVSWLFARFVSGETTIVTSLLALKLGTYSIFNGLIANLLVTYTPIRRLVDPTLPKSMISLHKALFNIVIAGVLIPTLLLLITDSRNDLKIIQEQVQNMLLDETFDSKKQIDFWYEQHLFEVSELASVAAQEESQRKQTLQETTEIIKKSSPDFAALYVGDEKGESITFYPPSTRGQKVIGTSFADREYFTEVKQTMRPTLSDTFISRGSIKAPMVTINVPIIKDNYFAGYVSGGMDLEFIAKLLHSDAEKKNMQITLEDSKGQVIASSLPGLKPMDSYKPAASGVRKYIDNNIYLWQPKPDNKTMNISRWFKSVYISEANISQNIPWKLIVEIPLAPYQKDILNELIQKFNIMLILVILGVAFSEIFSRSIESPIAKLAQETTDLPDKLLQHINIEWPKTNLAEFDSLIYNFISMSQILQQNFTNLEEQYTFVQKLIDNIPSPIFYKDAKGKYLGCNQSFEKYIGISFDRIKGKSVYDLFPVNLADNYFKMDQILFNKPGTQIYESRVRYADDSIHDVIFNKATFNNSDGSLGGLVGVILDITERKAAEKTTWEEKEKLQVTLQSIGDAVITTNNEGRIEYLNPVAEELTGWENSEAGGRHINDVFRIFDEESRNIIENPVKRCLLENRVIGFSYHTALRHKDGYFFAIEDSAAPIRDNEGNIIGAILVFHDVTEKRQLIKQLVHQSHHDTLTNLPNRLLFNDRLSQAIGQAQHKKEMLAILFIDLDRFKDVNDTVGHAVGDQLLKEVAQKLLGCIPETETVARLGGDEFIILLPQINNIEYAARTAEKIMKIFERPWYLNGHEFSITPSIGIAFYPNDGLELESLIKNADTAMYRAKERGGNNYQLYTPGMNARIVERLSLENSLRRALANNEFVLFYQPVINIYSGKVVGTEALLRWNHPVKGLVGPAEFMSIAEKTGLIVSIGEWVIRQACAQNVAWQKEGFKDIKMMVNISARQFQQENLVNAIEESLRINSMDGSKLELEITETTAINDVDFTIKTLDKLRKMGITIAIDDFGTGYSSLSYLKRFPINTLKVDRSFVKDIHENPEDAAIVTTILALAKNLNLKVVAEGVENIEQIQLLKELQCHQIQGYWFSKPLPAEDVIKLF